MQDTHDKIKKLIDESSSVVIIQADNPDADSLGSALAMEQILMEAGKETHLYCGVEMPTYLRYLEGWDRVNKDMPSTFDLSIIVDASTMTLLEKLSSSSYKSWVSSKPCIVLDHHDTVENVVPFATVMINDPTQSSAGQLIATLASPLGWQLNIKAMIAIMSAILGDTQGLSNQLTSAATYRIMADFVDAGVNRPALEEQRREFSKMPLEIFRYKAKLIERTEFYEHGKLAIVVVPQSEINQYSPLYNPAPLIQTDILQTKDVEMAVVIKHYSDGKVTGAIRSTPSQPIAAELADTFGGGGHKFASGFKIDHVEDFDDFRKKFIAKGIELINK
jgi:phosphoesterase RecJ-like protein